MRPGAYVVDATAGLGRDTAYLCRLVGCPAWSVTIRLPSFLPMSWTALPKV